MTSQRYSGHIAWTIAAALLVAGCSAPTPTDGTSVALATPPSSITETHTASESDAPPESDDAASTSGAKRETSAPAKEETADSSPAVAQADGTTAAAAVGAEVEVHDSPGGAVTHTFGNPTTVGAPLTFMVLASAGDWHKVQLPVRPNGSTGWVRASDVTVYGVEYSLEVSTADNTLDVYRDGALIHTFSVATGTGETPTPLGTYYLTELMAPTNSGYGPYAYGISAFSDVLNEFGGGPGQIGLHGTDDAGTIGQDVSHGCIRLSNEDITKLAAVLPLGTPIEIN